MKKRWFFSLFSLTLIIGACTASSYVLPDSPIGNNDKQLTVRAKDDDRNCYDVVIDDGQYNDIKKITPVRCDAPLGGK